MNGGPSSNKFLSCLLSRWTDQRNLFRHLPLVSALNALLLLPAPALSEVTLPPEKSRESNAADKVLPVSGDSTSGDQMKALPVSGVSESSDQMKALPASPVTERGDQMKVMPAPDAQVPLSGMIAQIDFEVDRKDLVVKGRHGLRITVRNNSDRALIFHGEKATAAMDGAQFSCMEIKDFDELFASPPTIASNLAIGARETIREALTLGAWQAVSDAFKSKNPLKRYGRDEERRQVDEGVFQQRVLWPGESSSGTLLFRCEQPLIGAVVSLPICSFFKSTDQAAITNAPPAHK